MLVTSTHPLLEAFSLIYGKCVRLPNDWHYIDAVMQVLHKLHIHCPQTGRKRKGDEDKDHHFQKHAVLAVMETAITTTYNGKRAL